MKIFTVRVFSALVCSAAWVSLSGFGMTPARSTHSTLADSAWAGPVVEVLETAKASEHPARITEWADLARPHETHAAPLTAVTLETLDPPRRNDTRIPAEDGLGQMATAANDSDDSIWTWLFGPVTEEDTGLPDPMADLRVDADAPQAGTDGASTGTETYALLLASLGALGFVARRRKI